MVGFLASACTEEAPAPADVGPACVPAMELQQLEPAGSGPFELARVLGSELTFSVGDGLDDCGMESELEWLLDGYVVSGGPWVTLRGCDSALLGADPLTVVLEVRFTVGDVVLSASWVVVVSGSINGCFQGRGPPDDPPDPSPRPGWASHADLPYEVTENSAAAIGTSVYVLGGFVGLNAPAAVWRYVAAADSWEKAAALPKSGYHHASLVAVDGALYMVAALTDGLGFTPSADTFSFTPGDDAWTPRALAPVARGAAGAAAIAGLIYVAGGLTEAGITGGLVAYDPKADTWDADLPPMALAREHVSACALNGKLHIFGGRIGGLNNQDAHEIFDPAAGAWEDGDPLPTPRSGTAAAVLNGRCHVFGGEQNSGTFEEHEAWSDDAGWVTLAPMPTARHGLGAAAVGSRIYVLGGGPQPAFTFSSVNESYGL